MTKPKLLFASALKPALDIRHEKLADGLAAYYTLHFCGVKTEEIVEESHIHSWKHNKGILNRLRIKKNFERVLETVQPDVIILSAIELAAVTLKFTKNRSTLLIYDIQENVRLNLAHQQNHRPWKKKLFEHYLKTWEPLLIKKSILCILAESCYENEIEFNNSPTITIENKSKKRDKITTNKRIPNKYCFTGTLSKNSGVLLAVKWYLKNHHPHNATLEIVGHTENKQLHETLTKISQKNNSIDYRGSLTPISHKQILKTINTSSFGIISYKKSAANEEKLPTKLFEYCMHQLPIVSLTPGKWDAYIKHHNAGVTSKENSNSVSQINYLYDEFKEEAHLFDNSELIRILTTTRKH